MLKATFGAGCFWGVEEKFFQTPGVTSTRVGYSGGHTRNPSYEEVCLGQTGHVEAVEIFFDPKIISYSQLVEKFLTLLGDPNTEIKRQYQSVIFFHDEHQKGEALKLLNFYNLNPLRLLEEFNEFFPAEERHQHYLQKRK